MNASGPARGRNQAGLAQKIKLVASASSTSAATATAATATSATAAAATAASTIAAATTATASSALSRRARFVDDNVAAHEILPIECLNSTVRIFIVGHFDKAKTARL